VSLLDIHATIADITGIDVDSRGQSLLGDVNPMPRLVEGHGLTAHRRNRLERTGHDVSAYDVDLRGVAAPPEGYGHRTANGWITERGDGDQLRAALDDLVTTLNEREDLESADLDDATLDQLKDLGYA
jgi:hypothetical protein